MNDKPVMKCGHVANAEITRMGDKVFDPPLPACAIHMETQLADVTPELTGRTARCGYCRKEVPSHKGLAFFEYRGAGSGDEALCKHCGCYPTAHKDGKCRMNPDATFDYDYEPRGPNLYDSYYCGCHGWD